MTLPEQIEKDSWNNVPVEISKDGPSSQLEIAMLSAASNGYTEVLQCRVLSPTVR
jgi:hypothetical protein